MTQGRGHRWADAGAGDPALPIPTHTIDPTPLGRPQGANTGRTNGVLMRPEAELRRESNGRESWVFFAAQPSELLGVHAEQVGRALRPGEEVRYLLYSPMWEGHGGPFGIRATPASHAIAVTESRFLISRDEHVDGAPPTLLSIPFAAVLAVESGSALMLAWLVVYFVEAGAPRPAIVLYRALGRNHVTAAVRACRSAAFPELSGGRGAATTWPAVWDRVGERQREELEPLLAEAEQPLAAAAWPAVVGRRRRGRQDRPIGIAPAGALLVSTRGLLVVGDDPTASPRSPNVGVNAVCIPFDALRAATFEDRTTNGPCVVGLRLEVDRGGANTTAEFLFPGESLREVERTLAALGDHRAVKDIVWSS